MAKVLKTKNLSGLGAERDVQFGDAPPERRAQGDYSKEGIPKPNTDAFDDYKDRQKRWEREYGKL